MTPAPRVRFYRNIVGTFVALNIVLLVFVVYLSFVKATIHIVPKGVTVTKQFIADISAKPQKATEVPGTLVAKQFEKAQSFDVQGGKEVEGKASGVLTIYNTTGNAQILIQKTRFLTKEGILFRLPKQVSVPAKGKLDVTVEADQPGAASDIGPSSFILPGLPVASQTKIYAESTGSMSGGVRKVAAVTQEGLDAAKKQLIADIFRDAQNQIATESKGNFSGASYAYELVESRSDTTPGTEATKFTVSVKLKVVAAFYDSKSLLVLAKAKLFESLSDELTLGDVDAKNVEVALEKYDLAAMIANVKVVANGSALLKEGGTILDKSKLVGLTIKDATDYLKGFEEVQDVSIVMQPFWVGKLPKLKDHIDIVIDAPKAEVPANE